MDKRFILYDIFMLLLTTLAIGVITVETVCHLEDAVYSLLRMVDFMLCTIFLGDFVWRISTEKDRWRYFRTWGWIDLLSSWPEMGIARYGRMFRVFRIIRLLRGLHSIKNLVAIIDEKKSQSTIFTSLSVLIFTIFFGSLAVLNFELESVEGNIKTAHDAIWWTIVTMTSTGYGDFYPLSFGGRCVAVFLMVVGLALTATFTALFVSWLMSKE